MKSEFLEGSIPTEEWEEEVEQKQQQINDYNNSVITQLLIRIDQKIENKQTKTVKNDKIKKLKCRNQNKL